MEMLDKILGPMDRELSEMLQAEYAKRGIKFYLSHKVTGVHGTEVSVEKDGETFTLHGDKVLLSVGSTCRLPCQMYMLAVILPLFPYWRIRQLARRRWPWIISWANRAR